MVKKIEWDLIVDSREQLPLNFRSKVVKKLDVGDYGCEINGELLPVVFERKSPSDAFSTLTSGHERFKKELVRAFESDVKVIFIVECSYYNFIYRKFDGAHNIRLPFGIVEKIVHKMDVRYPNLEFVFCSDRDEMRIYIRNYFNALVEEYGNLYKMNG